MALFVVKDFLYKGDEFGYFNDILKVVFAYIAITSSYMEAIFKRKYLKKFWKIYQNLQKKSLAENKQFFNLKCIWQNNRFLVIFYTMFALEFLAMLIFTLWQTKTRHLILFWSIFAPLAYISYLRNMQFIFYIELLRLELVKLQYDLNLLVEYSRFVAYGCGFRGFEEFLRQKLLDKQKHYEAIYDMFVNFQKAFGISIIAVLAMIYVRVLVDTYFAYYSYYNNWNRYGIVNLEYIIIF